jgi:hypothetical protein
VLKYRTLAIGLMLMLCGGTPYMVTIYGGKFQIKLLVFFFDFRFL